MNHRHWLIGTTLLTGLALTPLRAAESASPSVGAIDDLFGVSGLTEDVQAALSNAMHDPDTLNQALDGLTQAAFGREGTGLGGLLKNLNVKFKAFDAQGNDADSSLGLEYSYERALMDHELDTEIGHPISLSFSFHAKGNIAFDTATNPDDFLDTGLDFSVFGSKGGFKPTTNPDRWAQQTQQLLLKSAQFEGTPEELNRSPEWREFEDLVTSQLNTQYFWRAYGKYSLESDQSFSNQQRTYGILASGVVRAWNDESAWAKFNFADWPFAMLRYLTGADPAFRPSGQAIPLVVIGVEQVDPSSNEMRLALDPDTSTFARFHAEVSMKTQIARIGGKDVWCFANYRHYSEMGASALIRTAELDRFSSFAFGLEMENGMSLTYSTGRLPLDRESDRVYAIGWKLDL